ncbi:MAG: NADH-quinone oxidoreductase subunit G [Legionellales bacterium RIFCSPHIGHO2_12_FULL_42_9]|nr:MAG: NADH-quinone oxidoreductase subunit G [Legionellales bacterium RIFCSPHIGHO2_12_FULL_42_9]
MATIEIDGKPLEVENGKMIIEAADAAGIPIPRFCYHKKLSVAANCRMCLVQLEGSKKPVPACATPVANGMKILTKSEEAVRSQQAVMEFLLINHPLDCPICDQGGECELQDVSMGYGQDLSGYDESKRAVSDDDLGVLIATEMTRCIQCTRCVRFGDEIAGVRELGATNRGENMQIGTYVQHSMASEVSANIIDLCPVGALTSKPYRFTARAWEMTQHDSVAPHDCLGSNVYLHVRRNRLMRVVPKENESINETWLSDRDRFSYLGLNSEARATEPMIKKGGQWHPVDWPTALKFAADGMARVIKQHGPLQFAAFASPSSTTEEFYLLQKLMREMDVHSLDHRLHQTDFRDQQGMPLTPTNALPYADIEHQESLLLLGCNIHREAPLAGLRVRKAFCKGASIGAINLIDYDYHFDVTAKVIVSPQEIPMELAKLVLALVKETTTLEPAIQRLLVGLKSDKTSTVLARLLQAKKSAIITGAIVENHPDASLIRALLHVLASHCGISILRLTTGANAAGAWLAGMIPHRTAAGKAVSKAGLDAQSALHARLKGYFLLGVEPGYDFANPFNARQSMLAAECVVLVTAHYHESMLDYADVILPYAPYAETSGTYINIDNHWQSVQGAITPPGEARPAWKIIRVLGNLLGCVNFDYESSEAVLNELKMLASSSATLKYEPIYAESLPFNTDELVRVGEWPLYRSDAIVRNSQALQQSVAADIACIRVHPKTASRLKLKGSATVSQGDIEITLPLMQDARVALDVVWVDNAMPETVDLGNSFAAITIKHG